MRPILLLAATAAPLLAPAAAAQTTIHVPGDAPHIQAGLDLASDGDTVLVGPGVWAVTPLDFDGKAIRLKSVEGFENTVLNQFGSGRHILFEDGEGPDTIVEGFSFFSGAGPTGVPNGSVLTHGGSIAMLGDASPTLRDCYFSGNAAGRGYDGGNGAHGTDADSAGDDGGGAGTGSTGGPGGDGGAIWIQSGSPLIERCIFAGCRAGEGGRGGKGGTGGDGGPSGLFTGPGDGGDGGKGGRGGRGGHGGAIAVDLGNAVVVNSLFVDCRSGAGGWGGYGGNGGAGGESGLITQDGDPGDGGAGGLGGDAGDGGTFHTDAGSQSQGDGVLVLVNCTVTQSDLGAIGLGGLDADSGISAGFGAAGEGVVVFYEGDFSARNSIFWGNAPSSPLFDEPGSFGLTADVGFSNVQVNYPGVGNISSDPLWTTGAQPFWKSYGLGPASPCIDAGDAAFFTQLQGANKIKDLTGHLRRIDDPTVADTVPSSGPAIDLGAFEFVPPASVGPLTGCGVNTPGSLTLVSGQATLGSTITVGIDNPLGTQTPGSLAYFSVSLGTYSSGPCGLVLPGFGMAGAGAQGEFLLSYQPGFLLFTQFAGTWAGAGTPTTAPIQVSADPAVLGLPFYVQGSILDLSPGAQVVLGLTDGLRFVHGE